MECLGNLVFIYFFVIITIIFFVGDENIRGVHAVLLVHPINSNGSSYYDRTGVHGCKLF